MEPTIFEPRLKCFKFGLWIWILILLKSPLRCCLRLKQCLFFELIKLKPCFTYFRDELVKQNKIMSRCLVSIVVNKRRVLTEPLLYTSMSFYQQGSCNNNKTSTTFLIYTSMSFYQHGSCNNNKTSTTFLRVFYTSMAFYQQGSCNNNIKSTTFIVYKSMSFQQEGSYFNNITWTTFLLYTSMSFHQQGSCNNNKTSTTFLRVFYTSMAFYQDNDKTSVIVITNHPRHSYSIQACFSTNRAPITITKHQRHSYVIPICRCTCNHNKIVNRPM